MLFGAVMGISMLRFIAYGWIDSFFVEPTFHFKYYGFGWLEPLPRAGMHGLFMVLAALAFLIAAGACFRIATALFVLGFSYLQLLDVTTYLNHYYLASLLGLLLLISPADRAGSLRVWRKPSQRVERVPAVWLYVFRFQVGVVYTFAGLAKAHGDWLLHAQPLRIWLTSSTDLPVLGSLFTVEGVPMLMSWAGFLFDTSIPWLLSSERLRPFAYLAVLVFHGLTRLMFPIGMFPVIMVLSALVFFSPSWPRVLLRRLARTGARWRRPGGPAAVPAVDGDSRGPSVAMPPRWALLLMGVYCAVQVLMPLRSLAYGGDVRWHEQGMRFSWRVMVREKNGSVTFYVRQKRTGRTFYVSPHRYLTRLQEREMSGQPDLILQLAQHIARDFAARGYGDVEVRADALVSLNGRRMRRLIDPEVDLTSVQDSLAKAAWILPAPAEPPPHVRPI